ncbi:HAD-IIB family hydrolase [Aurantivibrio plasticivorans]
MLAINQLREKAQNIRLALFDVDGTIIGPDGQFSPRTKNAISVLQSRGVSTAIASGRPPFGTHHLQKALGLTSMGSFYAGAMLFEPSSGYCLVHHPLNNELSSIVQSVKADKLYLEVYTENQYWVDSDSEVARAHSEILRVKPKVSPFIESVIADQPVMKILIGAEDVEGKSASSRLKAIEMLHPEFNFAYAKMASHPRWQFASVLSGEVNRELSIERLADYYGIQSCQIMAFGDAQSDFAFIKKAGLGIAMGDAPLEVKEVANYVTGRAGDDGVANAIQSLFE